MTSWATVSPPGTPRLTSENDLHVFESKPTRGESGGVLVFPPVNDLSYWARSNGLLIVLVVLGVVLLTRFVGWLGGRITDHVDQSSSDLDEVVRSERAKHRHSMTQVLTWMVVAMLYCVAAVMVIKLLQIPISGFVAPATVVGVALGFGAQQIVQDLLAGFFLISEHQYGYGDVVRLNVFGVNTPPVSGSVEEVTLRVTRVRTLDGEMVIIRNGLIQQVINLSRDWARAVVDVPVPTSVGVPLATQLLHQAGQATFADPALHPLLFDEPTVTGIESLEVDQFLIRVIARTQPGRQFEVSRALRAYITDAFAQAGVSVSADAGPTPAKEAG